MEVIAVAVGIGTLVGFGLCTWLEGWRHAEGDAALAQLQQRVGALEREPRRRGTPLRVVKGGGA